MIIKDKDTLSDVGPARLSSDKINLSIRRKPNEYS